MNKTVLITGASRGIGFELSKSFLQEGYHVIGTSRTGRIPAISSPNFDVLKLDLSNNQSIEAAKQALIQKEVSIDILVNNAGIGPDLGTDKPSENTYNDTFKVNTMGTTFLTESLIPTIKKGGKIINISSKMGSINHCTSTGSVAYRMSKTALNMYTKILTNRLAESQIVAAVHPGWVRTTISENTSKNGKLSPQESAEGIYNFITSDFNTGIFWDIEAQTALDW